MQSLYLSFPIRHPIIMVKLLVVNVYYMGYDIHDEHDSLSSVLLWRNSISNNYLQIPASTLWAKIVRFISSFLFILMISLLLDMDHLRLSLFVPKYPKILKSPTMAKPNRFWGWALAFIVMAPSSFINLNTLTICSKTSTWLMPTPQSHTHARNILLQGG